MKRSTCDPRGSSPGAVKPPAAIASGLATRQATETTRIDKSHFSARRQLHDRVGVPGNFGIRRGNLHSASHAEVNDPLPALEGMTLATGWVFQVEDDMLAHTPYGPS